MKLETITFNGKEYPMIQTIGGAALWVREIAKQYCSGEGLDIGYSKKEWMFPGAFGVDECDNLSPWTAMDLPTGLFDYIHSSHCLEHVKENWYNVLDYWLTKLKVGGILFLYLPHSSQEYWLPENNRKHIHSFDGSEISAYLKFLGHKIACSGVDLNNSFIVVCEKMELRDVCKERMDNIEASMRLTNLKASKGDNGLDRFGSGARSPWPFFDGLDLSRSMR